MNIQSYDDDEIELEKLYKDILDQVHEGCDLVDNEKFLKFITDGRSDEITDYVRKLFSTELGAEPFNNIDDLAKALSAMYHQRVDFGLEIPALFDLPPFAPVDTCSLETQEVAAALQMQIFDGLGAS